MTRAMIGYRNHADTALVTVDTSQPTLGASWLQEEHVAHVWRSIANTGAISVDFGSSVAIDVVALMGLNLTLAGTRRVRASTSSATMSSGVVHDSGTTAGKIDPDYRYLVHLFGSTITCRYLLIELADTSLVNVEAGRLFAGPVWTPAVNFQHGWSWGYADPSRHSRSLGGQTWTQRLNRYRVGSFLFPALTEAERDTHGLVIQRDVGTTGSILFVRDPAAANLGLVTLWASNGEQAPLSNPFFRRAQLRLSLEERL